MKMKKEKETKQRIVQVSVFILFALILLFFNANLVVACPESCVSDSIYHNCCEDFDSCIGYWSGFSTIWSCSSSDGSGGGSSGGETIICSQGTFSSENSGSRPDCTVTTSQTITGGDIVPTFYFDDFTINSGVTLTLKTSATTSGGGRAEGGSGGTGRHWAGSGGNANHAGRTVLWAGTYGDWYQASKGISGNGGTKGSGSTSCSKSQGSGCVSDKGCGGTGGYAGGGIIIDASGIVIINGIIQASAGHGDDGTDGKGNTCWGSCGSCCDCDSTFGQRRCGGGGGAGGSGGGGGYVEIIADYLSGSGYIYADAGNGGDGKKGGYTDHLSSGSAGGGGGGGDGGIIVINSIVDSNSPLKSSGLGHYSVERGKGGKGGPNPNEDTRLGAPGQHGELGSVEITLYECNNCDTNGWCFCSSGCFEPQGTIISYSETCGGSISQCNSCSSADSYPCSCPSGCYQSTGTILTSGVCGTGSFTNTYNYEYDVLGNLLLVTFPDTDHYDSYQIVHQYNAMSQIISSTNPDSNEKTFVYDSSGKVVLSQDARDRIMSYNYDSLGRVREVFY